MMVLPAASPTYRILATICCRWAFVVPTYGTFRRIWRRWERKMTAYARISLFWRRWNVITIRREAWNVNTMTEEEGRDVLGKEG